jgi:hypothetical protein
MKLRSTSSVDMPARSRASKKAATSSLTQIRTRPSSKQTVPTPSMYSQRVTIHH